MFQDTVQQVAKLDQHISSFDAGLLVIESILTTINSVSAFNSPSHSLDNSMGWASGVCIDTEQSGCKSEKEGNNGHAAHSTQKHLGMPGPLF